MANVAIIDQNGALLSQLKSKLSDAGLDPAQLKYVRETENGVITRIEEILKPMLGAGNFKVQVAADIDFSQSEQTAESYRPNSTPETTSIRSQQNNETANINQVINPLYLPPPRSLSQQPAPLPPPANRQSPANFKASWNPQGLRHRSTRWVSQSAPAKTRRSTTRWIKPSVTRNRQWAIFAGCRRLW